MTYKSKLVLRILDNILFTNMFKYIYESVSDKGWKISAHEGIF